MQAGQGRIAQIGLCTEPQEVWTLEGGDGGQRPKRATERFALLDDRPCSTIVPAYKCVSHKQTITHKR